MSAIEITIEFIGEEIIVAEATPPARVYQARIVWEDLSECQCRFVGITDRGALSKALEWCTDRIAAKGMEARRERKNT